MTKSANNHRPRVARRVDKGSLKARTDRSALIESLAPNCPIWNDNPKVQEAGNTLVQAGTDLADGEALVRSLEAQAATAREKLVTLRITWDESFNVYASNVELASTKPEDITALGLVWLDEVTNHLAPPLDVQVTFDAKANVIRVFVKKPRGDYGCRIEISPDPIGPDSFQEVPGHGSRRALAGYAPGGYWVRAAMVDATGRSDFSPPVYVLVR